MDEFENITSFENLYAAFRRSKRGKTYKHSSQRFAARALDGIIQLQYRLQNDCYSVGEYNKFTVTRPKPRIIQACQFKDKIVQHTLCDNLIVPTLDNVFIYDSYGSQKDKGTKLARQRLRENITKAYRRYGDNVYIFKGDIRKYFYNIDHECLIDIMEYYFPGDKTRQLCRKFIDSTDDPGIALGNQINQAFANLYLDGLDKFIKNDLQAEFYGRYMDDFYIIAGDKQYLRECKEAIEMFIATLKLELNDKSQIAPLKRGVAWLGFSYSLKEGEIIARVVNTKKREAVRKYRRMAALYAEGKISRKDLAHSFRAWCNHLESEGCCGLIYAVRKIMEESYYEHKKRLLHSEMHIGECAGVQT